MRWSTNRKAGLNFLHVRDDDILLQNSYGNINSHVPIMEKDLTVKMRTYFVNLNEIHSLLLKAKCFKMITFPLRWYIQSDCWVLNDREVVKLPALYLSLKLLPPLICSSFEATFIHLPMAYLNTDWNYWGNGSNWELILKPDPFFSVII